jgi:dTDP-4-dehydrorhamnose reductase
MSDDALRVLLFGASGKVGRRLRTALSAAGYEVIAPTREEFDVAECSAGAFGALFQSCDSLGLVINAAAITNIERCEREPALALAVNAEFPRWLAAACRELALPLIHFSTDYAVADTAPGAREGFSEYDFPKPRTVYGRTKMLGELAVAQYGLYYLILRLSTIYDETWTGPLSPLENAAKLCEEILGYSRPSIIEANPLPILRQRCTPTSVWFVADAILRILDTIRVWSTEDWFTGRGTYGLVPDGATDRLAFIQGALADIFGGDEWRFEDYIPLCPRPTCSVMDNTRFKRTFGWHENQTFPTWQECLLAAIPDIAEYYIERRNKACRT